MTKLRAIIIGLVSEFDSIDKRTIDALIFEVDRKSVNVHGHKATSIRYTKVYNGPSSTKIEHTIEDLVEEDLLRISEREYLIDYHSKAMDELESLDDKTKEIIGHVHTQYTESATEDIIKTVNTYPEVEAVDKYTKIPLRKEKQSTLD